VPLRKEVKPDLGVWLPLLDGYRLTSLAYDSQVEGDLLSGLTADSPEVQNALAAWPAAAHFEVVDDRTSVVLVFNARDERGRGPWRHVVLMLLTLVTTLGAGSLMAGDDPFFTRVWEIGSIGIPYPGGLDMGGLWAGMTFALPFMGVLLAHEMAHYVAARFHRVRATLPYFIPFPPYFSIIGTVGAFIRLKGPTVRRSILFDIGASGPVASFLVSLPLLAIGLQMSETVRGQATVQTPFVIQFAGEAVWLGNGVMTHVLAMFFAPGSIGDAPILLHPVALVGWLGLFVTALNLLPLGQLDGGHILYSMFPEKQARLARLFTAALIPLGLLWWGWWGWAVLILVVHRGRLQHPPVVQPGVDLSPRRRVLGWILIAIFLATFVPVPLEI